MTVTFRVGNIVIENGDTVSPDNLPLATDIRNGTVTIGANIQADNGVISVDEATTSIPGVVQLNDTTTSASTTQALTANQGRLLQLGVAQAQATASSALPLSGGTMTGDINFVDEQPVDAGTY